MTFKDAYPVVPKGNNNYQEVERFSTGLEVPPVLNAQKLTTSDLVHYYWNDLIWINSSDNEKNYLLDGEATY